MLIVIVVVSIFIDRHSFSHENMLKNDDLDDVLMIRMSPYDRGCPQKKSPSFKIEGRPPQGTVTTLQTDTVHIFLGI